MKKKYPHCNSEMIPEHSNSNYDVFVCSGCKHSETIENTFSKIQKEVEVQ